MTTEIELKLLLDPADVAAFRRLALLRQHAIAKPRVQQLTSIHFDMAYHPLHQRQAYGNDVNWSPFDR